jgi:hypothetical protein
VDRGSSDAAFCNFIPTRFDPAVRALLAGFTAGVERPVIASEPLVETTVIEGPEGMLIPLIDWTGAPVRGLEVAVRIPVPAGGAALASGGAVRRAERDGATVFTLDLDVADALILRRAR